MIYWLADHFQSSIPFFRLFEYLTFRAIMSILTALLFSLWLGPRMIARLQMLQIGQVVKLGRVVFMTLVAMIFQIIWLLLLKVEVLPYNL